MLFYEGLAKKSNWYCQSTNSLSHEVWAGKFIHQNKFTTLLRVYRYCYNKLLYFLLARYNIERATRKLKFEAYNSYLLLDLLSLLHEKKWFKAETYCSAPQYNVYLKKKLILLKLFQRVTNIRVSQNVL